MDISELFYSNHITFTCGLADYFLTNCNMNYDFVMILRLKVMCKFLITLDSPFLSESLIILPAAAKMLCQLFSILRYTEDPLTTNQYHVQVTQIYNNYAQFNKS